MNQRITWTLLVGCALLFAGSALAGPLDCSNRCVGSSPPPCRLACIQDEQVTTCGQAGYDCVDFLASATANSSLDWTETSCAEAPPAEEAALAATDTAAASAPDAITAD